MNELPAPLTTLEHNIDGYDGFLLNAQKLMASELWVLTTGDEFKAAVGLWCRAWTQRPHGSLPDDDRILAGFSGAGAKWKKVKAMALRGFVKCSDGRLYHNTLCEDVLRADEAKKARIRRTEAATEARKKQRNEQRDVDQIDSVTTTKITLTVSEEKKELGYDAPDENQLLENQLRLAAGWHSQNTSSAMLAVTGPIVALIESGASLDLDVLPIIRRDAPRCRNPNWNYFLKAIAQARDDRLAAGNLKFEGKPNGTKPKKQHPIDIAADKFMAELGLEPTEFDS